MPLPLLVAPPLHTSPLSLKERESMVEGATDERTAHRLNKAPTVIQHPSERFVGNKLVLT